MFGGFPHPAFTTHWVWQRLEINNIVGEVAVKRAFPLVGGGGLQIVPAALEENLSAAISI